MSVLDPARRAVELPRLRRPVDAAVPPVRIVHLGLGAFHRAHQAWYTAHASDADAWGIAAFTGRSPRQAELLGPQDGCYTLVTRAPDGDITETVTSIVSVHAADDIEALQRFLSDSAVAVVTLTVTEAGYHVGPDGRVLMEDPDLEHDLGELSAAVTRDAERPVLRTAPGRLLAGLIARRRSGAGAIAVVPCDNLPDNGAVLREVVLDLAAAVSDDLTAWIADAVSFVSTAVDRITPRTSADDVEAIARSTERYDAAPVITEPFADWVLAGDFPAGRPDWASAGARLVDDVTPYEQRKLRLLNGAHTLLAHLGRIRGHVTVAEAIHDPVCLGVVRALWDECAATLPAHMQLADYRAALESRFANPRVEHRLDQIANDSIQKLRVRILPVLLARQERGLTTTAGQAALGAWVTTVSDPRLRVRDAEDAAVDVALGMPDPERALRALIHPSLA